MGRGVPGVRGSLQQFTMAPIVARRATGQLLALGPRLAAAAARRRRMVQEAGRRAR
jgi:hypothetical protein